MPNDALSVLASAPPVQIRPSLNFSGHDRRFGPSIPVVADQLLLVVSSPGCSVSCMRLASSAQRSCGAATNSVRMAALLTTFGPALLMRVKNFSLRGCIRRPIGDPPGPTYRRTPALREEVVRPQRTISGKKSTHPFPLPIYNEPGGLPQAPGRAA